MDIKNKKALASGFNLEKTNLYIEGLKFLGLVDAFNFASIFRAFFRALLFWVYVGFEPILSLMIYINL